MTEKKIALILSHMAEAAAPGESIQLWPAIQARLADAPLRAGTTPQTSRETPMNTQQSSSNRLRLAAFLLIALILACGLFLLTPQGQAWAQSLLRFFSRQASDAYPTQIVTPAPTRALTLVEQASKTAGPAATPTPPSCDSIETAHCAIEQAQPKISFTILQLSKLPAGMALRGAVTLGQGVTLVYGCPTGCMLLLAEEPADQSAAANPVGASAQVKSVQLHTAQGQVTGEYVQGIYSGIAGNPAVNWDANAPAHWLRWEAGGVRYSLEWLLTPAENEKQKPDQEQLAALAESLADQAPSALNPNSLPSAAEAALLAGFGVRTPGFTPQGYDAPYYSYDAASGFVCLNYPVDGAKDHPRMFVRESAGKLTELQPRADPSGKLTSIQYQPVQIGGADPGSARFTRSRFTPPANACNGQNDFAVTNQVLQWTAKGVSYEIYSIYDTLSSLSVSQLELRRMAESLTGASAIPVDVLDPENLKSIADATRLAGFAVKAPGKLPQGYSFRKAILDGGTVLSLYTAPDLTPGSMDLTSKPPVLYLYQCPAKSNGPNPCAQNIEGIPPDVKEGVTVHGQSGFYAKGDLGADESTNWQMKWFTDILFLTRRLTWQEGDTVYLLQLMWGGLLEKEAMTSIAESIR
jgi:hypothetical protein